MMIALSYARRLTLAFLAAASLVACADTSGAPDEAEGLDTAALVTPDDYVGDEGPGWAAPEADPTKAPGWKLDPSVLENAPARVVLDHVWFGQPNGYWCGPGSTRMALRTRMPNPPPQTEIAELMGTTTQGTARADLVRALNFYLNPETAYLSIPMDGRPTQDQRDFLKQNLVARLSTGWPIVANVLSGWRPPGYPSGTIGHFVTIVGYDDHGEKVMIADPAAEGSAGPRWENVPRTYWVTLENLGTWIGGRGYSG